MKLKILDAAALGLHGGSDSGMTSRTPGQFGWFGLGISNAQEGSRGSARRSTGRMARRTSIAGLYLSACVCLVAATGAVAKEQSEKSSGSASVMADSRTPPPRCFFAIGAATRIYGNLVADQILEQDPMKFVQSADSAVNLSNNIGCPKNMLFASLDCVLKYVQSNAKRPDVTVAAECTLKATGVTGLQKN